MFIEDPGLAMVMAIPVPECSPRVSINVLATCRMFKKDVNSYETNLTSPLESTRVSKNKPKSGPKQAQETSSKCVKEPKQSQKETQKGNILARFSRHALLF